MRARNYFQFAPHPELAQGFATENGMQRVTSVAVFPDDETCFDRPAWFASKAPQAYDIWICPDEMRQCILLSDRTSRDVFFAGCQL